MYWLFSYLLRFVVLRVIKAVGVVLCLAGATASAVSVAMIAVELWQGRRSLGDIELTVRSAQLTGHAIALVACLFLLWDFRSEPTKWH